MRLYSFLPTLCTQSRPDGTREEITTSALWGRTHNTRSTRERFSSRLLEFCTVLNKKVILNKLYWILNARINLFYPVPFNTEWISDIWRPWHGPGVGKEIFYSSKEKLENMEIAKKTRKIQRASFTKCLNSLKEKCASANVSYSQRLVALQLFELKLMQLKEANTKYRRTWTSLKR